MAGLTEDVLTGRVEGAGTDPWTAVQVVRGRQRTMPELLAGWRRDVDEVAGVLESFEETRAVFDVQTHEHDVRHALGLAGNRSSEIVGLGADRSVRLLQERHDLRVELDDGTSIGAERPDADVTLSHVTAFEVFRSRLGRRSAAQVAAYDWDGDRADVVCDWFASLPRPTTSTSDDDRARPVNVATRDRRRWLTALGLGADCRRLSRRRQSRGLPRSGGGQIVS